MMAFTLSQNITGFLEKKGLTDKKYEPMMKAFEVYAKSAYADLFGRVEDSVTIELTISRMDEDRLNKLWTLYIADLRQTLPDIGDSTHAEDKGKWVS
jgi:hypothetical protein